MLSIEEVIGNDDLLTKILLKLPAKSIFRFKSVSKHWHTLITKPHFSALRNPENFSSIICLIPRLHGETWEEYIKNPSSGLNLIPLVNNETKIDGSRFESNINILSLSAITILNSCNGLLLIRAGCTHGHYILNPTTKQFETLPEPDLDWLEGLGLVYDPSKSHHYKVVAIPRATDTDFYSYKIKIYSSETKKWKDSGERFTVSAIRMYLSGGVYWNGAINWLNMAAEPMYYNIDEERVGLMPFLPIQMDNIWYDHYYFGESHGHLHFVEFYSPMTQYNVYEMKKDYTEWVVKYQVDLTLIATRFPGMMQPRENDNCHCSYSVIFIDAREKSKDGGSFMVLYVLGKFIRYHFIDKSYKIVYEYEGSMIPEQRGHLLTAYPYIESLFSI